MPHRTSETPEKTERVALFKQTTPPGTDIRRSLDHSTPVSPPQS